MRNVEHSRFPIQTHLSAERVHAVVRSLEGIPGIYSAFYSGGRRSVAVEYDPRLVSERRIDRVLRAKGIAPVRGWLRRAWHELTSSPHPRHPRIA